MPTITLCKDRVLKLLGKKVSDDVLRDRISYLGTDLEEINSSQIIVEIFPNRPDLLSEEGFARALKSFMGFDKGLKSYFVNKGSYSVVVDSSVSSVRPFTTCLVAKNLKISDDVLNNIINIQEKLHVTFGRNRKKCAIGVYPLDNIVFPVHYKALSPDKIVFTPLGEDVEMNGFDLLEKTKAGRAYGFLLRDKKKFPVFVDSNGSVMSVPPILNSKYAGTVSVLSRDLFVECSGHDFDVVNKALSMVGCALSDMGADIFSVNVSYDSFKKVTPDFSSRKIYVDYSYINKYLGLSLSNIDINHLIERMGFGVGKFSSKGVDVLVPCFRADVIHPVDVVEDVCIGFGFDNVVDKKDNSSSVGRELYFEKIHDKFRDLLVGDGLLETMSYSLVNSSDLSFLGFNDFVKIKNPSSSEFDALRSSLVISLLKNFKNNKMHDYPQSLFEIGRVFNKNKKSVVEFNSLIVGSCSDSASFTWGKQRVDLIKNLFDLDIVFVPKDFDFFIKGRSAELFLNYKNKKFIVGFVGEVNINVLRRFDLNHGVSLFELNLDIISNVLEDKNKD